MAERALHEAIERLSPDQREALRMLKLSEMSLKEASESSGQSVSALTVATHRAVANLRRLLKGEPPP
jgi:DNA-directed RNA polymerase specialized sigma24 family protein